MKNLIIPILLFSTLSLAKLTKLYTHKDQIWGLTKVSNTEMIFTTRKGEVFSFDLKTNKAKVIDVNFPNLKVEGQGGLLDAYYYKDQLYFTYSYAAGQGNTTRLAKVDYKDSKLSNFKVIYTANAFESTTHHYGSRLIIKNKKIFMSVGERGKRDKSQDLTVHNGKILRLNLDGSIPSDNPYITNDNKSTKAIYSYGHRNPQGLTAFEDKIYEGEFGPQGGDEINLLSPKSNYGWPIVTFGEEYGGGKIGKNSKPGFVSPIKHWIPSLSFSEILIHKGYLYLACLGTEQLVRLKFDGKNFTDQEKLSNNLKDRFRALEAIDDKVYFATDAGVIGYFSVK